MDVNMKDVKKKIIPPIDFFADNLNKLLAMLIHPETNCVFWKIDDPHAHIMGIRPVKRTTVTIINENGFNPYEKKTDERLFKCFKVFVLDKKNAYHIDEEEIKIKKDIEKNGIIYIKNYDLIYIVNTIRNSN